MMCFFHGLVAAPLHTGTIRFRAKPLFKVKCLFFKALLAIEVLFLEVFRGVLFTIGQSIFFLFYISSSFKFSLLFIN